jgi:hypothetical protein
MSPMRAMPTTTVAKMMGASVMRMSLTKPSPSGLRAMAKRGKERAEDDAEGTIPTRICSHSGPSRAAGLARFGSATDCSSDHALLRELPHHFDQFGLAFEADPGSSGMVT